MLNIYMNGWMDEMCAAHLDHRVWRWRVFAAVIAGDTVGSRLAVFVLLHLDQSRRAGNDLKGDQA